MATALSATQLLQIFRNSGVSYRTRTGWRTHNRGNRGDGWGITDRSKTGVHGVMIHHTGRYQTVNGILDLLWTGYAGLPGPLCHAGVDKEGVFHMMSAGRSNHAGGGDPSVLQAVITERYTTLPAPRYTDGEKGSVDGNARFYGFELLNQGDGKDLWPDAQVDAAARAAAGICLKYGWTERSVIGHKEWQRGKPDPTFSMDTFRQRVRLHIGLAKAA